MKGKKADFNMMVAAVITVAAGLVILVITYQIYMKSGDTDDDQKCMLSLFAASTAGSIKSASPGKLANFDNMVALECPRKLTTLKAKDVVRNGVVSDYVMKAYFAKEMKSCWSKSGAGKLDPFRSGFFTSSTGTYCMVCSEIVIDKEVLDLVRKQRYQLVGLPYWSTYNKLPGMKISLYEFIEGKKPTDEVLQKFKEYEKDPSSLFNLEEKYVVAWVLYKKEGSSLVSGIVGAVNFLGDVAWVVLPVHKALVNELGSQMTNIESGAGDQVLTGGTGAGVGLGTGKKFSDSRAMTQEVYAMPEERLVNMCNTLIN